MKTFPALRSVCRVALVSSLLPALAHAHPGHEGHELTWDLEHLAAHPVATLGWVVILAVVVWSVKRSIRLNASRKS